jgi:hypothetical protein
LPVDVGLQSGQGQRASNHRHILERALQGSVAAQLESNAGPERLFVGRISYGNVEFSACLGDNNGGERVSDDLASDMKRSMPIRTPSERDRKRRSDK